MMYIVIFPTVSTLIKLKYYALENDNYLSECFSVVFSCKKAFPALFYTICGSVNEHSFTPIILWRVSLCLMNFCSCRKLPSKVLSDSD